MPGPQHGGPEEMNQNMLNRKRYTFRLCWKSEEGMFKERTVSVKSTRREKKNKERFAFWFSGAISTTGLFRNLDAESSVFSHKEQD
jgi:hypothetical protein